MVDRMETAFQAEDERSSSLGSGVWLENGVQVWLEPGTSWGQVWDGMNWSRVIQKADW